MRYAMVNWLSSIKPAAASFLIVAIGRNAGIKIDTDSWVTFVIFATKNESDFADLQ